MISPFRTPLSLLHPPAGGSSPASRRGLPESGARRIRLFAPGSGPKNGFERLGRELALEVDVLGACQDYRKAVRRRAGVIVAGFGGALSAYAALYVGWSEVLWGSAAALGLLVAGVQMFRRPRFKVNGQDWSDMRDVALRFDRLCALFVRIPDRDDADWLKANDRIIQAKEETVLLFQDRTVRPSLDSVRLGIFQDRLDQAIALAERMVKD